MLRKLFWVMLILGGYIWAVSTDEDKTLYDKAKSFVQVCLDKAEANDFKLHIHTPECFKDMKKRTK